MAPRRRRQALIPLALLALGVLYNWSIAGRGLGMTFSKTLAAMLPYFALGMLAALALHGRTISGRATRALLAGGVALVLVDAIVQGAAPATGIDATFHLSIVRDLPAGAGFALVVAALASAPRSRVVGSRLLAGIGTISYGFYLWHVPVLLFLRGQGLLPLDPLLGTAVALVPVLGVSALSWVALERPITARAARRSEHERSQRRRERASGRGGVDRPSGGREVGAVRA